MHDITGQKKEGIVSIFENFYANIAEEPSYKYIVFQEFPGRIQNSLETVGAPYLATVFRSRAEQFSSEDWRKSILRRRRALRLP